MLRHGEWKWPILVSAVGLVILVGVGAAMVVHSPNGQPAPPPRSPLPKDVSGFGEECTNSPLAYPNAAAYEGQGPHPAYVGNLRNDIGGGSDYPTAAFTDRGSFPPGGPLNPSDSKTVQLAVCITDLTDSGVTKPVVGTCGPYGVANEVSVPVIGGIYELDVYALKQGSRIASLRLRGADTTCPNSIECQSFATSSDGCDPLCSRLTDKQVHAALHRFTGV